MGYFGGAAVNQALKANRDLLKKRTKRKRTQTTVSNKGWIDHKHATAEQLVEIRNKIYKQQKISIIKTIITMMMIILGTITIIYLST
ncbi:hypothetical protein [uncultured Dokdonia sp.]|uniref:hypothetical protein n=1 Tax=uncultured Dokdonia sp. TaxID=575653 RepID=UPI0026137411|nr:hypothetical protein [uncultured Dokdonia sp.]